MKLVFAIVNSDDSQAVGKALLKSGFYATKLASTGGFLSSGNTTFLTCIEEERIDDLIEVIRQKSHRRTKTVPNSTPINSGVELPVEVEVGGATIFVTDVERFEKL
ncbi:MAG: cyclic-di-AMP receptor [Oscillospiraceae bacterium]|nr:cyclic-di-AMP receptor [Oscillospiraceae bacterium]MBR7084979.1 cyclic-di-AMP receptor [Oscillospiraceae bacterium]